MLERLCIENIALIDRLELELGSGFNVLSGETGAGKSIIIDAMNFVLGERASRDLVKFGAARARAEAVFDISDCKNTRPLLENYGIDAEDGELILSRELVVSSGKNICRINGSLVPVTVLREISATLIDIHGQHEHQSLLDPEKHIDFLDGFAASRTESVMTKLNGTVSDYNKTASELKKGFGTEEERRREADMLTYQLNELQRAKLTPGEEEGLLAEKKLLANAEHIREALEGAYSALSGEGEGDGALASCDAARRKLQEVSDFSPDYASLEAKADDAYYSLEDISYTLRDLKNAVEFDGERLEEIEQRLETIADMKRKYGRTEDDCLEFAKKAAERLGLLSSADERSASLKKRLDEIENEYNKFADELAEIRRDSAESLRTEVLRHLAELGLEKSDFSVRLNDVSGGKPRMGGRESAEFYLTTNPGEQQKPLEKVASGGELSRIMLCFKAIFADNDGIATLIFDEIDTGISGRVAAVVGEKMLGIAKNRQVICVTHLPQIAALAEAHYLVEKTDDGKQTFVNVKKLDDEGKIRRVAQMMDGEPDSEFALKHAEQLIERNRSHKSRE